MRLYYYYKTDCRSVTYTQFHTLEDCVKVFSKLFIILQAARIDHSKTGPYTYSRCQSCKDLHNNQKHLFVRRLPILA